MKPLFLTVLLSACVPTSIALPSDAPDMAMVSDDLSDAPDLAVAPDLAPDYNKKKVSDGSDCVIAVDGGYINGTWHDPECVPNP
jgi:hypothetical protein